MKVPVAALLLPKPCILYRRLFVGHPDYRHVSPDDARTHMRECEEGCADFYLAVTQIIVPAPTDLLAAVDEAVGCDESPPAIAVSAHEHCLSSETITELEPQPGSPHFHLLVCDACRLRFLRKVCDTQRKRYEAPADPAPLKSA